MFSHYAPALKSLFLQILLCIPESENESWIRNSLSLLEQRRLHKYKGGQLGAHTISRGLKVILWQEIAEEGRAT
jgi:hypothetical protein